MSSPGNFSNTNADDPVQPCPLRRRSGSHWIEIELVGEDGNPVPWEHYEIKLPDGTFVTGLLDGQGRARVDNISAAGDCEIVFANLDADAWEPYGSGGAA